MASSGKSAEKLVVKSLRDTYGLNIEIDRLPDKYDTGKIEEVRPSDFLIHFSRPLAVEKFQGVNSVYLEVKENGTDKLTFSFSRLQDGQVKAMHRCKRLNLPYFVAIYHNKSDTLYLVPAVEILLAMSMGKKSLPADLVQTYEWKNGELYDFNY